MAIRSRGTPRRSLTRSEYEENQPDLREILVRHLPAWLLLMAILGIMLPPILGTVLQATVSAAGSMVQAVPQVIESTFRSLTDRLHTESSRLAPLFTAQIDYWSADLERWSTDHDLDPNLLATVMQIESCGHPTVGSSAGAQGLFQVMPFHFASGENQLDPNTNASRGADYLKSCLGWANGDPGRALACYNGGPSVLQKPYTSWAAETQRYYYWGTGIYADAQQNQSTSTRLDEWLAAGGGGLCQRASTQLGIPN